MHRPILAVLLLLGILGGSAGCRHQDGDGDRDGEQKKRTLIPPKEPGKRPQGMTALKANAERAHDDPTISRAESMPDFLPSLAYAKLWLSNS